MPVNLMASDIPPLENTSENTSSYQMSVPLPSYAYRTIRAIDDTSAIIPIQFLMIFLFLAIGTVYHLPLY